MRILNVIFTVDPKSGGPIEWVRQYGKVACSMGHIVEIATLDEHYSNSYIDDPLVTHYLGKKYRGFYSRNLIKWLKKNCLKYDLIIVHGIWRFHSFGTWIALKNSVTPYYVYTHGMLDPWFKKKYPIKHILKSIYWQFTDYNVLKDAISVIFTCEEEWKLSKQSFNRYKCNKVILNLGIASSQIDIKKQKNSFYSSYPKLIGKKYFLFLGRIHEKKGCDILIDAFSYVCKIYPNIELVMAGPDQTDWVKKLKKHANEFGIMEKITWTGMISGELKWGAIRCAEALVLPSHQENFGIVVAEALSCGVPTLITNKVNIYKEILKDKAGFVEDDNEKGIRLLLERFCKLENEEYKQLKENAIKCYKERFDVQHATINLLRYLLTRRF